MKKAFAFTTIFIVLSFNLFAQNGENEGVILDYLNPGKYTLAGIDVTGDGLIHKNIIIAFSGLRVGETISVPGNDISLAIQNLWKQKLFSDIKIKVTRVEDREVYLEIETRSRPRLSRFAIEGVSKNDANKIREEISLVRGDIVTQQLVQTVKTRINDFYAEKGYLKVNVEVEEIPDSSFSKNSSTLRINIDKGDRVRIKEIVFHGNTEFSDAKLQRVMKETKTTSILNILKSSKFIKEKYKTDKEMLIAFYNTKGFRDAKIVADTIYYIDDNKLRIEIKLDKGNKYYFRNISWSGNTKYKTSTLNSILGIEKGEVYNPELLQRKLFFNPNGLDISSLYMDNGYLFFNLDPVETKVINDSIDIEIRMYEGPQATIDEVTISGNVKTSDHVILREIRTRPGDKFSRSEIIRTQRELSQLGFFDPEQMDVVPKPDPVTGTVDIEYKVVERPNDQLELQGGYGRNMLVGSVGLVFNNFSSKKIFDFSSWSPLPTGDGQRVSLRAQTNGRYFSSLNFSFTEPWFGGKKPNSLTFSSFYSIQSRGRKKDDPLREEISITGASFRLGKRLKWPDDYFTLIHTMGYQLYKVQNWESFIFRKGESNNFFFEHNLSRSSIDQPIYPRSGSNFSISLQWTPPFSLFNEKDYTTENLSEKYKWIEYHKWNFNAAWYLNIVGKLVLAPSIKFGYLGYYNKDIGPSPFERFKLGGGGIQGYNLIAQDLIALRGYEDESLSPPQGATIFNKYTLELRYPIVLQPSATVYVQPFLEAGNSWLSVKNFDPYNVYRSAGIGVRLFLPMFGLLGVDYGWGLDRPIPGEDPGTQKGELHFIIGQQF